MKEKYILYGVNRVSKDFIYMFDDLIHIVGVIDEEYSETVFLGKRVYDWQVIDKNTKLIICDLDKTDKKEIPVLKIDEYIAYIGKNSRQNDYILSKLSSSLLNKSSVEITSPYNSVCPSINSVIHSCIKGFSKFLFLQNSIILFFNSCFSIYFFLNVFFISLSYIFIFYNKI